MKHLSLPAALVAALALGSCQTSSQAENHWHIDSIGSRIEYHFFGTIPDTWPVFKEETSKGVEHVTTTLRRHFLNNNPDNPLQPEVTFGRPSQPEPPDREFTVGG